VIIDAHHHLWKVGKHGFEWPTPDLEAIYRDFSIDALRKAATGCGLSGTVLVQSQPSDADTDWLTEIAVREPLILGVVGWVDFSAPDAPARIVDLSRRLKFRGLRPMLQSVVDTSWILQPTFDPVFEEMVARDLRFDALIQPRHLGAIAELARRHPALGIVIDHGAKPNMSDIGNSQWAREMEEIASQSNVYCKISGLPVELGEDQPLSDMEPYIRRLAGLFGSERLMWGSDWPVVNLRMPFADWLATTRRMTGFEGRDMDNLLSRTASEFYRLNIASPAA